MSFFRYCFCLRLCGKCFIFKFCVVSTLSGCCTGWLFCNNRSCSCCLCLYMCLIVLTYPACRTGTLIRTPAIGRCCIFVSFFRYCFCLRLCGKCRILKFCFVCTLSGCCTGWPFCNNRSCSRCLCLYMCLIFLTDPACRTGTLICTPAIICCSIIMVCHCHRKILIRIGRCLYTATI